MKRTLQIGIALLLMAVTVQADIFGFGNITTNSPNPEAIADQLFMDVNTLTPASSSVTFTNTGPSESSISEIYFGSDLTTLNLSIDSVLSSSAGVSFDISGASPANPPGFEEFANWWSITIAAAESEGPGGTSHNGINPFEYLELGLSYTSTSTLSELIQSGELQVALHVISIGEYSDTFVNDTTVIPEPASLILMGSVGSLLGFVRKRFAV
jgi:hypothetical protein